MQKKQIIKQLAWIKGNTGSMTHIAPQKILLFQ